jgi:lipopolysaccharide transport system ATP-binding protein
MSWAIQVENLSKQYKLGTAVSPAADTLYQAIEQKLAAISGRSGKTQGAQPIYAAKEGGHLVLAPEQLDGAPPNHFWALRDVSFQINEGDRVGIVGKNGSGKSTLLKILSRITTPTYGVFRFRGRLISLLEVGTGFHPDLSGRENIMLNARINGMSTRAIRQVFDDIVEFSELGRQIDTPIKRYSSGMYMRLAFSVAAHLQSDVLIVDEVLAVGDAGFQKKCLDKMLEISGGGGRTLLFVSHDMNAIAKLCTKALELSHGRVISTEGKLSSSDSGASDGQNLLTVNDAISGYVLDGVRTSERTWDAALAPRMADGTVVLTRVAVAKASGATVSRFDVKEDIFIAVEFDVLDEKWRLNTHVYLTTLTGHRLFVSMDNLDVTPTDLPRRAGRYRETCHVGGNFLNEGIYRVEVVICTNPTTQYNIVVADAVTFSVDDDMTMQGTRGDWLREWPDYPIRPRLKWAIDFTEFKNENSQKNHG